VRPGMVDPAQRGERPKAQAEARAEPA